MFIQLYSIVKHIVFSKIIIIIQKKNENNVQIIDDR